MQKQIIHERIDCLREVMRGSAVDAVLVFSADPHLSECPPAHWQTRQWLSGFTGSAGVLLLTKDFAGLWTDSRYHEQAAQQLSGTGIMAVPVPAGESHAYARWLTENLASGSVLSVSAWEISAHTGRALKNQMRGSDISLRTDVDLPGQIWADRPALPHSAVYAHSMDYAGKSRQEKLAAVREVMCQKEADWHFISALDDIAWLLNLRGADMPFSPLFLSHLLLGKQGAVLFVDADRVPPAVRDALLQDGIGLQAYDKAASVLTQLPSGSTVLMDAERVSAGMYQSVGDAEQVVESLNPTLLMKSRKTEKEIAHIRRTALCDGIALCEFFAWFEDAMACGDAITELDVAERLDDFRREQPGFVSPSFRSIVAFNANAALPHYQATADHNTLIRGNGLLLIDSGGQYLGGTTDITRVVPIGTPSAAQKRDFTLVLKGLIALSSACFPCGIPPAMLDAIARTPLWSQGLDYGHGTGHGIGYFLNVHEGPQSISRYAFPHAHTVMEEGMITSIEPGVYRTGHWGVRLENMVVNRQAILAESDAFLCFETLTLCPIELRCVDETLLSREEIRWLDRYHAQVRDTLFPTLSDRGKTWLLSKTVPLEGGGP